MREVKYNKQRDNLNFGGTFSGWRQCFGTSAWMLIGYYAPDSYDATNDTELAAYLDDVEIKIGKKGIGEEEVKEHGIEGWSSIWWPVQQGGITKWLRQAGYKGKAVFMDATCSLEQLDKLLLDGPVIMATNKLGGLPGGHIILIVDQDGENYICNDPFGDATGNYQSDNGQNVKYKKSWLKPYIAYHGNGKVRCMYWQPETAAA